MWQNVLFSIAIIAQLGIAVAGFYQGDLLIGALGIVAIVATVALFLIDKKEMKNIQKEMKHINTAADLAMHGMAGGI